MRSGIEWASMAIQAAAEVVPSVQGYLNCPYHKGCTPYAYPDCDLDGFRGRGGDATAALLVIAKQHPFRLGRKNDRSN